MVKNGICSVLNKYGVHHRTISCKIGRKMKDEDTAKNHTADPVGMGRKSCQYNYIFLYWKLKYSFIGMIFWPCSLDHLYAFGAISSSSILQCYLYRYNLFTYMASTENSSVGTTITLCGEDSQIKKLLKNTILLSL